MSNCLFFMFCYLKILKYFYETILGDVLNLSISFFFFANISSVAFHTTDTIIIILNLNCLKKTKNFKNKNISGISSSTDILNKTVFSS